MERAATVIPGIDRAIFGSALELMGATAEALASSAGGEVSASVIRDASSPDPFVRKHLGPVKYEEIALDVGLGMSKPLYDWIGETWSGKTTSRSGALLAFDQEMQVRHRRDFVSGVLSETWIPALNGASKDPALMRLVISPQGTKDSSGSGKVPAVPGPAVKRWMSANFRVEIAGLDASRVGAVDGFVVRSGPNAKVDFPDLRLWTAAAFADQWRAWFDDFVTKGHNDPSGERAGAIVFLAPDRLTELGRIALEGLGIRRIGSMASKGEATVASLAVDLYCQRMSFLVKK